MINFANSFLVGGMLSVLVHHEQASIHNLTLETLRLKVLKTDANFYCQQ